MSTEVPGSPDRYFSHIDGIRAIAIGLVILFHFGLGGATQGFLGVDIFFVVSGFLVGGMIFRGIDNNAFSLLHFFRRRIARIFPALLVTAVLVLVAGYLILLPMEFAETAASIRAAIFISANRYFYFHQDYFGPGKMDMHFLHSWSLSVEEQFYLFFPLVAMLFAKLPRVRFVIISALMLCSLAAYEWVRESNSASAFYTMLLRSWELLAGVALAIALQNKRDLAIPAKWLGAIGLILAVFPAFGAPLFPAVAVTYWQFACVAGTLLLISSNIGGKGGFAAALLMAQPVRAIGLISYSLYLVHWPILTLGQAWNIVPLDSVERVVLILLSILVAAASWTWVEMPMRRKLNSSRLSDLAVIAVMVAIAICVALAATLFVQHKGMPDRLPKQAQPYLDEAESFSPLREKCHSDESFRPIKLPAACAIGDPSVQPSVAVWGDSHGVELSWTVGQALNRSGDALVQLTSSGCPPLLGVDVPKMPKCNSRNTDVLDHIRSSRSIKTVILAAYYLGYAEIDRQKFLDGISRTVRNLRLAGKHVVIVGPIPRPRYDVPKGLARQIFHGKTALISGHTRARHEAETACVWAALSKYEIPAVVDLIDPASALCTKSFCSYSTEGQLAYFDASHLSVAGANRVTPMIMKIIAEKK